MTVLAILAGACMTISASWACGRLALRPAGFSGVPAAIAYGTGAALLSLLVFVLSAAQLAGTWIFCAIGVALVAVWIWIERPRVAMPRATAWLIPLALFGVLYFVHALAPESSADGTYYHVAYPARYFEHGGLFRIADNMYASLSQGVEMLFLFAYAVGRHSAPALVHLSFLFALAAAMVAYGRLIEEPAAGWLAAVLVFTSPVAGRDASVAYNDVALACFAFLVFLTLELWSRDGNTRWLPVAGLLAGFCYAIKHTGVIAAPFAVGFVFWRTRSWKQASLVAAVALLPMLPWMVKNWLWVENPVAPFFNRAFPNPYMNVSTEDDYTSAMRAFGGRPISLETPLDATVRGGRLQGLTGPVFLLAPVALLGLANSTGRRLLLAGSIFLLPWLLNLGTRFLIPSLAFFALALARVVARRGTLAVAALATAQTAMALPPVVTAYCDSHAWRISDFPWRAALRLTPESEYLDSRLDTMPILRMIDANTPPDAIVYTALPLPQAYSPRTILLDYASAKANQLRDIRWSPLRVADQPVAKVELSFAPQTASVVRLRHTGDTASCPGFWSIFEMNLLRDGAPQDRSDWTASASRDPWRVDWALDGNIATRWKLWRAPSADATVTIRLPRPVEIDQVRLDTTGEPANGCVTLELARDAGGDPRRVKVAAKHSASGIDPIRVRREAGAAMRRLGVTHLLIHKDEPDAADFDANAREWGVRRVAEAGPGRLFALESK